MPRGLKIAFFGSSLVSAYWNGAATYYRGIIRALHEHGHEITFFEPDAFDRQQHRDIPDPAWARVVVYRPHDQEAVLHALDSVRHMDWVVKCSGVGVLDAFLEEAVLDLQRAGTLVAFWDVDAPATLDRAQSNAHDPFRQLIPRYDLILTYGGGHPVVGAYRHLGARECVPVYNALDPSTHHPVTAEPALACDLALLANRMPDRESRVEEFFFRAAALLPQRRFLLGGNGWQDKQMPANVRSIGHVYTREHNAINSSARAVLNVNRESMAKYGYSPPTRIFEAAGAGSCIITDAWPGIEMFLEPGAEVLVASGGEQVAGHLESLDPERARRIGERARRRILSEHTYRHRAAQLESLLQASSDRFQTEIAIPRA